MLSIAPKDAQKSGRGALSIEIILHKATTSRGRSAWRVNEAISVGEIAMQQRSDGRQAAPMQTPSSASPGVDNFIPNPEQPSSVHTVTTSPSRHAGGDEEHVSTSSTTIHSMRNRLFSARHRAQASSSSGVQAVDELYRKEDNPTQAAPCHAGARQTTKSTAFTPDSAGRIEMKNLQLENELLKARVRALDMDEGIMKRSSRRGGDENRSYLPAEHALLEELRDVKKHLAESEQRNEENTLEKGKIEKELEAVRSRYDNLLAENNTLHLGEDKFKLMEVEISALSDEVDRLTKELKRERHSRNESTDEEVRALKCHISRLEHDRRAELAAASVEARVETAKIESLTQLLREERQKNSELAKQLDDAARAEIELMKANSLQERSVRDETATKRAEAQLTKCKEQLIEARMKIHRKNGELDKALEELRVNEEKLERANERIREANKELKSTHGKIDELKQCVRGMQRQLSNVDRVSTDLTSVTAERDRLVKKLNDKDARLSTAIEEIELLKEAFEQESSQRQLADLQCQNIQEELDRVKRELEKSRRINDDILLDKETGGKKVQEQQRMVQESKIPSLSKQHDHSRQLVTMSLDDYNAEAVRVEEIIAELTKERQKFQVLSQEVTKLRNENDELRARSRRIDDISWDESIQEQMFTRSNGEPGRITSTLATPAALHASEPSKISRSRSRGLLTARPLLPPNLGSPNPSPSLASECLTSFSQKLF